MHPSHCAIFAVSGGVAAGITLAWWPDLGLGLAAEHAPLAWLQSMLLAACACAAGLRAAMPGGSSLAPAAASAPPGGQPRAGWTVLALLLVAAALDERFMFHERVQDTLLDMLPATPAMPRLVQGVTAIYAAAGLVLLAWLRRAAVPAAWPWFRAAVAVGIVAIGLDVAFDTIGPQIIEELLEAAAETLMLCGLFTEVRTRATHPR